MLSSDGLFLMAKKSVILLATILAGSFILSAVENYINIENMFDRNRNYKDSINSIAPFKTFIFAPIFETFLIYLYIRMTGEKKYVFKYIFFGICMGVFHEYYQPKSFLSILFVFSVMTYGLVDFLNKYGRMVSITLVAVIHSLYNIIVVYFF
ncbi:hypothetical protein [Limnohabitans sp. G3-2]|uniref:hypothetical protein n=1 Tax=Limnohabitans sp. G3-2 TaxID=1100711 RepID=UPI00117B7002|nr:hypothetical protein [Limnohabitans sp. G3-2]